MSDTPKTCEVVKTFDPLVQCGKPAVMRYPAHGGGWMYLCEEHGQSHAKYAERIEPVGASK